MRVRRKEIREPWALPQAVEAGPSVVRAVAAGLAVYRRETMLPRLIPLLPSELAETGAGQRRRILARLARALRAERNRGRAGHWTYDLNRHIGLKQAYEAERRLLGAGGLRPAAGRQPPG
jgi:hypothetical protein